MTERARHDTALDQRRHRRWVRALTVAVVVVASGCDRSASSDSGAPLPESPPRYTVTMRDFSYEFNPKISPGRGVFEVINAGAKSHEILLSPQPEEYPHILEQVRGSVPRANTLIFFKKPIPPGTSDAFAVDLAPGRYAIMCFVSDDDHKTHAEEGMAAEFVVPAPTAKTAPAAGDQPSS